MSVSLDGFCIKMTNIEFVNKAIEIAKKMKQQEMSIETIKEITNLDFEEIEKL